MFSKIINTVVNSIYNLLFKKIFINKKRMVIALALLAAVIYFVFYRTGATPTAPEVKKVAEVEVASVGNLASGSEFTAVGTVSAVSEAKLQTEAGGRIVGVYVTLGSKVAAGSIIAKLDGAAASAGLLQAQGGYEAALAGAAGSNVGVSQAENGLLAAKNAAVNTYKNAYTSVSGALYGTVDQFFTNPDGQVPGVRLGSGNISFLNSERVSLQTSLKNWKTNSLTINPNDDLNSALNEAVVNTKKVLGIVDAFIEALNREKSNAVYTEADLRNLGSAFNGVRAGLVGNLAAIEGARTGLTAAEESLKGAKISSANQSGVSASGAQIKLALGSLRAAQANYEKTLVRTPISGVVNALYLKAGEYASPSQPAAIIANNNNGLEINTSVSQEDSVKLKIGDKVLIDKLATGTIAAIGGAIDPSTGKVALKVSVADNSAVQNGTTVSLAFVTEVAKTTNPTISIPLASVKMTGTGPIVFTVEDNTLKGNPVVLGTISGANVVVTEGINSDTVLVTDARGLKEGATVTVKNK